MRLPQIQITTTDIQLEYSTTLPKQEIRQPRAELSIEQPAAILEIHTKDAQLKMDSSQLWSDLGMKPTSELIAEYAQKGKQALLKGISRRMSEGRQMMKGAGKDQGRSIVPNIAKQNHGPKRPGPLGIDFIPSYKAIKFQYVPGSIDIHVTPQKPKIDSKVNKVVHHYTPGDVHGTMVVRPDVHIEVNQ